MVFGVAMRCSTIQGPLIFRRMVRRQPNSGCNRENSEEARVCVTLAALILLQSPGCTAVLPVCHRHETRLRLP